jgi:ubiquinone/menaquinone biosynthesis C-methylase UbiE
MEKVISNPKSIEMHSQQSNYYKYRTPYLPKLFEKICEDLSITKESTLMDLGCGTGEVSSILSNYAGQVHGIDGSSEIIELAQKKDNITYQVVDLNSANPVLNKPVNHIFFGRSIHWFPAETLKRLTTEDLFKDNGKIVVCSTQWRPIGEWGQKYFAIKQQFVSPKSSTGQKHDFTGKPNLTEAGFKPVQTYTAQAKLRYTSKFIVGHTLATTYGESLVQLEKNLPQFEHKIITELQAYDEKHEIIWEVTSWAIVYKK